ncbi:LacI family DNA-binding transcriptional regulator [Erwinia sp. Eh17-17]|jgi:LacI family transcriptional regulator|uniref:LacI family DNA-binding transcriptional regulator n=1 Tax=Erwinia sp. Eh17-17 TaxID=3080330 RepID=UPI0032090BEB
MKKHTLDMLAKKAGVGVATVDRVLNERGGVSPEMTRKVLLAAQEIGLNRILPAAYQQPWQIEVFLSGNGSFFFKQLAQDFGEIASHLGYRRMTLLRTFTAETQPEKLARLIVDSSQKRDGMIVVAHHSPALYEALAVCKARGVPVITIVTDLPDAERLCHVGINQMQAGRTAGLMMGRMVRRAGEVVMVSGRCDYSAHRQRIAGFRAVLEQKFPELRLREVLAGQDQREVISRLLEENLSDVQNIVGLYNTGSGNTEVSAALERHKLLGNCVYITHELYSITRRLMADDLLALTLDQNARMHAQLATDILLRHLEEGYQPTLYADGKVDFRLITPENA